jgi:NAD(P)-dependent dehydrogenase (short-subunit alcohol dehydrogenase family)
MKSVVITGSTRGIGLGLAREFLRRGHQVVISGRTSQAAVGAAASLARESDATRVLGVPCDVTRIEEVEGLWREAARRFGRVDMWINNAGISHAPLPFWDLPAAEVSAIVQTNVVGLMNGCHVALRGMIAQKGGVLFNMEGFGSNGMKRPGMSVYGATKAALRYFTDTLVRETKDTPVVVAALSPGIVTTDLLLGGYAEHPEEWQKAKKFLAIAADRVETVAPFLVDGALSVTKSGARVEWLTTGRLMMRFASSPFVKRDVIPADAHAREERTS